MSRMRVVEEMPLAQALDETDIVICGSLSSVAVETALMGVPTLLIGDPDVFTTSPAEGCREFIGVDARRTC